MDMINTIVNKYTVWYARIKLKASIKEIFRTVIDDFHTTPFPAFHRRAFTYRMLPQKAVALIGVRRSGKTTLLYQIMQDLMAKGASLLNMLYVNFVDERLDELVVNELGLVLDAYYEKFPEKRHAETVYFFFDEIQNIPGWELFVERVLRQEKCGVFLSGSSAKMLSREIATELRGRSLPFEVFPYSFQERLAIRKIDPDLASAKNLNRIAKSFKEHLIRGGFPEVLEADERTRLIVLQDYFRTVLYRDVVERYNVATPHKELRAMQLLCHQAGGLFTATKTAQKLKAQGVPASPNDILTLVHWLNDAYFFYPVPVYSESLARQNTNPKKAYLVDTGMMSVLHAGIGEIWGHLLENLVFMEMRRKTEQIFYYKDRAGREVDFVISHKGRTKLIQVSHNINDAETIKREIRPLWSAMDELGLKEGYIFTTDTTKTIRRDKKMIHVLPAWKGVEQMFS